MALFGVLLIHFAIFSGERASSAGHTLDVIDQGVTALTKVLVRGKSIACFSTLFGIGLFIQFERAALKGIGTTSFALRRMGSLFVLGMLHYVFVWNGDVLSTYALLGFFLLPFTLAKPRTFLISAFAIFSAVALLPFILEGLHLDPRWSIYAWNDPSVKALHAASSGSLLEVVARKGMQVAARLIDEAGTILPLFILGALMWKSGLPQDPVGKDGTLRRLFHGTFWLGLGISLFTFAAALSLRGTVQTPAAGTLWTALQNLGTALLALGYFTGLLRLLAQPRWSQRFTVLAPLGRMALTNYIAHSVILTLIFSSVFRLEGRLRPGLSFLLVLLLYALQVAWSHWWLNRFRFGPLEWLWRCLTYWKMQPLLLSQSEREKTFSPSGCQIS